MDFFMLSISLYQYRMPQNYETWRYSITMMTYPENIVLRHHLSNRLKGYARIWTNTLGFAWERSSSRNRMIVCNVRVLYLNTEVGTTKILRLVVHGHFPRNKHERQEEWSPTRFNPLPIHQLCVFHWSELCWDLVCSETRSLSFSNRYTLLQHSKTSHNFTLSYRKVLPYP